MKSYKRKKGDSVFYYKDEKCTVLHREDGPAIEWDSGYKSYFLNDKLYAEEDYLAIIRLGGFA